jgi:hypothetical protein
MEHGISQDLVLPRDLDSGSEVMATMWRRALL